MNLDDWLICATGNATNDTYVIMAGDKEALKEEWHDARFYDLGFNVPPGNELGRNAMAQFIIQMIESELEGANRSGESAQSLYDRFTRTFPVLDKLTVAKVIFEFYQQIV
jgi:hypothetical protein